MRNALLTVRSILLWTLTWIHFIPGALGVTLLGILVSPQRLQPFLRFFCRNVVRLTGARFSVRRSPGFATEGVCFYAVNHVEIFDPFVIVSATDRPTRGLELESHFKVPVYGWMMQRLGSVPVPDRSSREGFVRMRENTKRAFARGISLVVYPEGTRTRTGRLGRFRSGLFRLAVDLQVPVVPVSVTGLYEVKRVGSARLSPGEIVVHLHDAVPPGDDPGALRDHVRAVINEPLEAARASRGAGMAAERREGASAA